MINFIRLLVGVRVRMASIGGLMKYCIMLQNNHYIIYNVMLKLNVSQLKQVRQTEIVKRRKENVLLISLKR